MYLHSSPKLLAPGFVLLPQPNGYVSDKRVADFERYVESRRPAGMRSRYESVFLYDDSELRGLAGYMDDAVYEVQIEGPTERSDYSWYEIARLEFDAKSWGFKYDQHLLDQWVDAYWAGTPYHHKRCRKFEHRVPEAVVVGFYKLNVAESELQRVEEPSPSVA